jgi:hypothetical protein
MADYTKVTLARSVQSATVVAQSLTATDDMPAGSLGDKLLVRFTNPEAQTVTVVIGAGATGLNASQGTLSFTVAQNEVKYVTLETARFAKATGDINIACTIAAGGTLGNAKLEAIIVPV